MDDAAPWDLSQESTRLETFGGWPRSTPSPHVLSNAGFFYTQVFDRVCCFHCHVTLGDWELREDPFEEHATHSPDCRFMRDYSGGSTRAMYPMFPRFAAKITREKTFETWPIALKTRPHALSEAGFFYNGEGDRTICYHCGLRLWQWEDDDDPWVEHAINNPECYYVLSVKGSAYVSSLKRVPKTTLDDYEHPDTIESNTSVRKESESDIAETDTGLCKVCYLNELCVVFLPCAHLVSCVTCTRKLISCPVCRHDIKAVVRVHIVR